jgi:hypothetical protein
LIFDYALAGGLVQKITIGELHMSQNQTAGLMTL